MCGVGRAIDHVATGLRRYQSSEGWICGRCPEVAIETRTVPAGEEKKKCPECKRTIAPYAAGNVATTSIRSVPR